MGLIKKIIGFAFVKGGIIWAIFNKPFCRLISKTATYEQLAPCHFLFLFVGIIFIVCGASLLLTPDYKKKAKTVGKK